MLRTILISIINYKEGQGLMEYALIFLLVALVVILSLTALGQHLSALFDAFINAAF